MTSDFEMAPCGPSPVLPVQMFWGPRWDGDTSGPRALMLAVLEDAVRCLEEGRRRSNYRARRLAAEAEAWVRSRLESSPPERKTPNGIPSGIRTATACSRTERVAPTSDAVPAGVGGEVSRSHGRQ